MNPIGAGEQDGPAARGPAAARARAHARALNHSDRVRRLRRLIPLAAFGAVAALAAYVLNPFAASLPGVSVGPVTLAGTKVRMESPRLSGYRRGARGYEVTADAALQDVRKPGLIELERMRGHIATDDQGGIARLSATRGLFDTGREALDLEADVRVWTDKGEEARLRSAAVAFKTGSVTSREPVSVTTPRGTVEADALDVVENGRVITFLGNVRVVVSPQAPEAAPDNRPPLRVLTSDATPLETRP